MTAGREVHLSALRLAAQKAKRESGFVNKGAGYLVHDVAGHIQRCLAAEIPMSDIEHVLMQVQVAPTT